jgi:glycosyltransferase involved in cell wall biosynthesis
MTPRTVLYISPSSRLLGARRSLLQLTTNLDPARYRPVVITKPKGDLVDALEEAGVTVHPLFMGEWRKGRYFLSRPFKVAAIARIARRENAALIHCNEFHSNPYGVRAARRAGGLPVVTHMRLSITPRQIRNYDLCRAARVLCVSRAAARDFEVSEDWRERVEVVYNGVDLREFQSSLSLEEARARIGLSASDFVVGQFGLTSPRKRPHLLLRAAAILRNDATLRGRLRVLLVGSPGRSDASYAQELRETVAREGLEEMVRFIPFTPQVVDLYRACDVNTLVSNDEGFGRTIIEAGALGVPSVGAKVGGIPELILSGETGFLVSGEDDGAELAERLRTLSADPNWRREMGRAARTRVETHFSIQSHARKVMDIYDHLLKGTR